MATERKVKYNPIPDAKEAQDLVELCERHLDAKDGGYGVPLESKSFVEREAIVRRWAARHREWNLEKGVTLAESWFLALCYQQMAAFPNTELELQPVDCIRLMDTLKNICGDRNGTPALVLADAFEQIAYAMVFLLSNGMEETEEECANQHYAQRVRDLHQRGRIELPGDDEQRITEDQQELLMGEKTKSESAAGLAVLGLLPWASRTFWHAWVEALVTRDARELKSDEKANGPFQEWMKQQFGYPTQQAFRMALADLYYKHCTPMGAFLFHERGMGEFVDAPPAFGVLQMELTELEVKAINTSLDSSVKEMGTTGHPASSIAAAHMFAYTFNNRLTNASKKTSFEPFLIFKWDIAKRLDELTGPLKQWGRPRRPIVFQTQSGWFLNVVTCDCCESTADHKDGPGKGQLRRVVYKCAYVEQALCEWVLLMRRKFKSKLACDTQLNKLIDEIFPL